MRSEVKPCTSCLEFEFEIDIPTMFPVVYLGSLFQSLKLISDHRAPEGKAHGMVSVYFLVSSARPGIYPERESVPIFVVRLL